MQRNLIAKTGGPKIYSLDGLPLLRGRAGKRRGLGLPSADADTDVAAHTKDFAGSRMVCLVAESTEGDKKFRLDACAQLEMVLDGTNEPENRAMMALFTN